MGLAIKMGAGKGSDVKFSDASYFYRDGARAATIPDSYQYISNASSYHGTFQGFPNTLDLAGLSTTGAEGMSEMFSEITSSTMPSNLSVLDTSTVTNFSRMFAASSFTSADISSLDMSSARDITGMFYGCTQMTSLTLPASLKNAPIEIAAEMFRSCLKLTSLNLSGMSFIDDASWDRVTDMISYCNALTTLNVSGWVAPTYMSNCFNNAPALQTITGLDTFDASAVSSWESTFAQLPSIVEIDLSKCVATNGNVKSFASMFSGDTALKRVALGKLLGTSRGGLTSTFEDCSALEELVILEETRYINATSSAFTNSGIAAGTCQIYVPDSLLENYKAASVWKTYASQIHGISEYPGTPWWAAANA